MDHEQTRHTYAATHTVILRSFTGSRRGDAVHEYNGQVHLAAARKRAPQNQKPREVGATRSCEHRGLHGGGTEHRAYVLAVGLHPQLRQRLPDVVDALQRHVRARHQRRPPHLHRSFHVRGTPRSLADRYWCSICSAEQKCRGKKLTATVWKPAAFPAAMLRALSSKNTCHHGCTERESSLRL